MRKSKVAKFSSFVNLQPWIMTRYTAYASDNYPIREYLTIHSSGDAHFRSHSIECRWFSSTCQFRDHRERWFFFFITNHATFAFLIKQRNILNYNSRNEVRIYNFGNQTENRARDVETRLPVWFDTHLGTSCSSADHLFNSGTMKFVRFSTVFCYFPKVFSTFFLKFLASWSLTDVIYSQR